MLLNPIDCKEKECTFNDDKNKMWINRSADEEKVKIVPKLLSVDLEK